MPGLPHSSNVKSSLPCLAARAKKCGITLSESQLTAAGELRRLQELLQQPTFTSHFRFMRRLWRSQPVRGVYLWGGVGRGKSFLMDSFFACVESPHKKRAHFHRFMQEIHGRLERLKGKPNPLRLIAREIADHVRLLCLDEFHITDIADAMLMKGLLQGLLDEGVAIVVTSNAHPASLYRNGLQRSQFLPTIDLLEKNMAIIHFDGDEDYRMRNIARAGVYHSPVDEASEGVLAELFNDLARGEVKESGTLVVAGRPIPVRGHADGLVWFNFKELCGGPRNQADYIELAKRFHTILLSGIPQFDAGLETEARRFLWLVDVLYDHRVRLVLTAAAPLASLAPAGLLHGEFERILSRLTEMQTHAYLAQPHLPELPAEKTPGQRGEKPGVKKSPNKD